MQTSIKAIQRHNKIINFKLVIRDDKDRLVHVTQHNNIMHITDIVSMYEVESVNVDTITLQFLSLLRS